MYSSVVSELAQYIQEMYLYGASSPVFKLSKVTKLIKECMGSLVAGTFEVNCTRVKEQLLPLIPGLQEGKDGNKISIFQPDVGSTVRDACGFNNVVYVPCAYFNNLT